MQASEAVTAPEFSLSDRMWGRHVECEKHPLHLRLDVRHKRVVDGTPHLGEWIIGECGECGKERELETKARAMLPQRNFEIGVRVEEELGKNKATIAAQIEEFTQAKLAEYRAFAEQDVHEQWREYLRGQIENEFVSKIVEQLKSEAAACAGER